MAVRTTRVEIFGFSPERREEWRKLSVSCKEMTNRLWQVWLCHHTSNDAPFLLRQSLDLYKVWEANGSKEPKPDWPCSAMGFNVPNVPIKGKNKGTQILQPSLTVTTDVAGPYRVLSREYPHITSRVRVLLENAWSSKLKSRKATTGNLPGWVSILVANEGMPNFAKPLPIPFDKINSKIFKEGTDYVCELGIERLVHNGASVVERCLLMLNKRKCRGMRATVDKIISGEYAWRGSNLVYEKGKWFAMLAYVRPDRVREKDSFDTGKVLFIRPGRQFTKENAGAGTPWRVRVTRAAFGSHPYGGNGVHVEYARRRIISQRNSRKEHFRWSGNNQKGHGRQRAEAMWTRLSSHWKDFTKQYNNEVTQRIVKLAKRNRCSQIVYMQPHEEFRDKRFLTNVGNDETSAMAWDYFQFGSMLAGKCQEEGIEYVKKPKTAKRVEVDPNDAPHRLHCVWECVGTKGRKRNSKKLAAV